MADIEFCVTSGPFVGDYQIDMGDITASDIGDLVAQGGPDLDALMSGEAPKGLRMMAGLVWLVRRRGSKGLSYRSVADHLTIPMIGEYEHGEPAEKSNHPSTSADA